MTAYPKPPEFGPTGSRVTAFEVKADRVNREVRIPQPMPPSRSIWGFDEGLDEDVFIRERTPEEFADEMRKYTERDAEWRRTGGVHFVDGPTIVSVKIVCEDGTRAEGFLTGDEWRWSAWETKDAASARA